MSLSKQPLAAKVFPHRSSRVQGANIQRIHMISHQRNAIRQINGSSSVRLSCITAGAQQEEDILACFWPR